MNMFCNRHLILLPATCITGNNTITAPSIAEFPNLQFHETSKGFRKKWWGKYIKTLKYHDKFQVPLEMTQKFVLQLAILDYTAHKL